MKVSRMVRQVLLLGLVLLLGCGLGPTPTPTDAQYDAAWRAVSPLIEPNDRGRLYDYWQEGKPLGEAEERLREVHLSSSFGERDFNKWLHGPLFEAGTRSGVYRLIYPQGTAVERLDRLRAARANQQDRDIYGIFTRPDIDRGFFSNTPRGREINVDPTTLAILGMLVTLAVAVMSLVRGR